MMRMTYSESISVSEREMWKQTKADEMQTFGHKKKVFSQMHQAQHPVCARGI